MAAGFAARGARVIPPVAGDMFLDVDHGGHMLLQLPPAPILNHHELGETLGDARCAEKYSVTVVLRVAGLPSAGQCAALLRFSQPADVSSRYRLCANLFLDASGCVLTREQLPVRSHGSSSGDDGGGGAIAHTSSTLQRGSSSASGAVSSKGRRRGCVRAGEWHVLTVNVDCAAGHVALYVDGDPAAPPLGDATTGSISTSADGTVSGATLPQSPPSPPQLLALGSRITLFGGGRAAEHRGGQVRLVAVRRGALLTETQIRRQTLLKDPSVALPRVLCISEPAHIEESSSQDDQETGKLGSIAASATAWPDENRRQCVWLQSVRAAGALGHEATQEHVTAGADGKAKKDTANSVRDDLPPEAERT